MNDKYNKLKNKIIIIIINKLNNKKDKGDKKLNSKKFNQLNDKVYIKFNNNRKKKIKKYQNENIITD